jgi:hypothetical protein
VRLLASCAVVAVSLATFTLAPRTASAMGAGFFKQSAYGVTDQRVAIAVGRDRTVLWSQFGWTGNPDEVAWAVPIRHGAKVTVTGDAWFASLEGSTQPVILKPPHFGVSGGCMMAACGSSSAFDDGPDGYPFERSNVAQPIEQVVVQTASTATQWLADRGFVVPANADAPLEEYEKAGYDFALFRMKPDCGARRSRVVRVEMAGVVDAVVPLRLISVGGVSPLTLRVYAFGATRLAPVGYASANIDIYKLAYDDDTKDVNTPEKRSNYDELVHAAFERAGFHSWLTEYADTPPHTTGQPHGTRVPSIFEAFPALCGAASGPDRLLFFDPEGTTPGACPKPVFDAGIDSGEVDGGIPPAERTPDNAGRFVPKDGGGDASKDAASDADADASDSGTSTKIPFSPDECGDDLDVVTSMLDPNAFVLTRLHPSDNLPLGAEDLHLGPAPGTVSNELQSVQLTSDHDDVPSRSAACITATPSRSRGLSFFVGVTAVVFALRLLRRRRR